jgi:hypothetical protein
MSLNFAKSADFALCLKFLFFAIPASPIYTMHRPDEEFINLFREKFGDLFLSCHGERGMRGSHFDAGDPLLHANYPNDNEPSDVTRTDEPNTGQTVRRESGSPNHHKFHAPGSFSPMVNANKHETFHDRNLQGSGAVFHNKAGDLHSPVIQWNSNISPLLDKIVQRVPQIFWNGPDCFTPLAESQRWLYDNTHYGQADGISRTLTHHDLVYATLDGADQDILTDCLSEQPDSNFDLATSEAQVNGHWPYGDGEKNA